MIDPSPSSTARPSPTSVHRLSLAAPTAAGCYRPLVALRLAAAAPAWAQPARFEIDPEHLSVGFLCHHLGYAKVLGMFRAAKGSFQFDEKSGALSDVRIEVDTASVFTNHRKRDDHLKGPDFLNCGEYPKMSSPRPAPSAPAIATSRSPASSSCSAGHSR